MTRDELIEELKRATVGNRELDAHFYLISERQLSKEAQAAWNAPIPLWDYALQAVEWYGFQFTTSCDAMLPGTEKFRQCIVEDQHGIWHAWAVDKQQPPLTVEGVAATEPLARRIAELRALVKP